MSTPTPRPRRRPLPLLVTLVALVAGTGVAVAAWVAALLSKQSIPPSQASASGVMFRHVTYAGHSFTIAVVDLDAAELALFWKKPDGSRYGAPRFELSSGVAERFAP